MTRKLAFLRSLERNNSLKQDNSQSIKLQSVVHKITMKAFLFETTPRVTHEHGTNFNLSNDAVQNIFTIKQDNYL